QARGEAERVGPQTDVFGLGAVLYQLLTGQPPYAGESAAAVREQARQGRVRPPRQLNPRVPRTLERICLKALAADPAQRYASAAAMGRGLRRDRRRPLLLARAAVPLLRGVRARPLPSGLGPAPSPGAGGAARAGGIAPLAGELRIRVWSKTDPGKRDLEIGKDFAALPVRNQEQLRLDARLNAPAHVYVLWLDSDGRVTPLYPWNERKLVIRDAAVPPPLRPVLAEVSLPLP